jgi:hypothetical protein
MPPRAFFSQEIVQARADIPATQCEKRQYRRFFLHEIQARADIPTTQKSASAARPARLFCEYERLQLKQMSAFEAVFKPAAV